jgi:phosphate starvation-inducible PhoH-like protein
MTSKNEKVLSFDELKNKKINFSHIKKFAEPKTRNLKDILQSYDEGKFIILDGCPGTGKTFTILNKCIQEILGVSEFQQIVIVRSIVPVRDIGFLKGTDEDKVAPYEEPYQQICAETFGFSDGSAIYDKLKQQGIIKFRSTSFNQGITLHNSLILVDESQNLNYDELYNIVNRVGDYSKIFFTGDFKKQNMLTKSIKDKSGFENFIDVVKSSDNLRNYFSIYNMTEDDVVRSPFVKDFIIADNNYNKK